MDNSYLVRLKPYDPRRGQVLRRFTYKGIKFQADHGWYRVDKKIADYLRTVRPIPTGGNAPLAFDVCTPDEAQALDAQEQAAAEPRKAADGDITLSVARDEPHQDGGDKRNPGKNRNR